MTANHSDWGLYPWFEEQGRDLIHPDDLSKVRDLQPNGKVLMRRISLVAVFGLVLVLGSTSASAQEAAGSYEATSSDSSEGQGLGVGVEATLTGLSGAALVYDAGAIRIDGVLGISSRGNTDFFLAGRFWYVLHAGDRSDISIGGGLGIQENGGIRNGGSDDIHIIDTLDFHVEAGAQIRAFITNNVALSASGGFGVIIDEGDEFLGFGGQLLGTMGVTYFF